MSNYKNYCRTILLIILTASFSSLSAAGQQNISIKITNIKKNTGMVILEIYNSKSTWLKTPYQKLTISSDQTIKTATLKIPYGKYAISIYQDLNGNGQPDMNFLGIPKELIGFGNNYKPFGEPKFESCLVEFTSTNFAHEIKLYKVF